MQFRLSTLLLLAVVLWSSLAVFGPMWGLAFFVMAVGLSVSLNNMEPVTITTSSIPRIVVTTIFCLLLVIVLFLPTEQISREHASRAQCANNLRNITTALLNYEAKYHSFPPAHTADKNGRPMHSWRVLILPFLGEDVLYRKYNFDEPWDGPNNRQLLADRPTTYGCPTDKHVQAYGSSQTSYVAVVGSHAAWPGSTAKSLPEVMPASSTMLLVETTDAGIAWTQPRDLLVDSLSSSGSNSASVTASSRHGDYNGFFYSKRRCDGINVSFADGHQQFLSLDGVDAKLLAKYLRIGGFEDASYVEMEASQYQTPPGQDDFRIHWPNIAALLVWLLSVGLLMFRAVRSRKPKREATNSST